MVKYLEIGLKNPCWNFLYLLVGVEVKNSNHNVENNLFFFGILAALPFRSEIIFQKPNRSEIFSEKYSFNFGKKKYKPNCRLLEGFADDFQEN